MQKAVPEQRARELACAHLGIKNHPSDRLAILNMRLLDGCWVVGYQSREYAETGDIRQSLVGNGPLLIDEDERVYVTGSPWAPTPEVWIRAMRKNPGKPITLDAAKQAAQELRDAKGR